MKYKLRLFVSGDAPNSTRARKNLELICRDYPQGQDLEAEVIDISENMDAAIEYSVVAVPALIRWFPEPAVRILGDLSDIETVVAGIGITAIQKYQKSPQGSNRT